MNRERLESAKKILGHIKGYDIYEGNDHIEILEWLIEQVKLFHQTSKEKTHFNYYLQKNMPKKLISKVLGRSVIEAAKKLIEHQKDELETLQVHNNDLLKEIRVLKNKIATFNKIYDEQLRIDDDES